MTEIKWIKITTDIFDDEKILLIENMPEHDSIIVIWFKLLALAGKSNNNGVFMLNDKIPYTDEMLASIFRRPLQTVRLALDVFEKFGMIVTLQNVITIPNWEKHQNKDGLDKLREQTRVRVAKCRNKQKELVQKAYMEENVENLENVTLQNVTCNVTVTECNALEEDKNKNKNKNKNNIYIYDTSNEVQPTSKKAKSFFENEKSILQNDESIDTNCKISITDNKPNNKTQIVNTDEEETSNEVLHSPRKQKKSEPKHKYGQYQNVLLTDKEYESLKQRFGEEKANSIIQFFSEKKEMKGYVYKKDAVAINNWVVGAFEEKERKNQSYQQKPSVNLEGKIFF